MKMNGKLVCTSMFILTLVFVIIQAVLMFGNDLYTSTTIQSFPTETEDGYNPFIRKLENMVRRGLVPKLPTYSGRVNGELYESHEGMHYRNITHGSDDISGLSFPLEGVLDRKKFQEIIQRIILKDKVFNKRENLDKLVLTVEFIKYTLKIGGLNLDQLKNILTPPNFDGNRFLLANSKDLEGKIRELKILAGSVNLTEREVLVLDNLQPTLIQYKWSKKGQKFALNMYNESNPYIKAWQRFHNHISPGGLYSSNDSAINDVIHDLRTQEIVNVSHAGGGTQIKMILTLANGAQVLFKPMRFPRTQEMLPDHFYFSDYERHISEIAAFNLDRVLGFNRCPPVAGRYINITRDIKTFASWTLLKTFFISPSGNVCFHGKCEYYCDTGHAICGNNDILEGSFALFLPSQEVLPRQKWRHPWRRSYSKKKFAVWEKEQAYCSTVRELPTYSEGRRLLDLMDLSTFDFLIGNLDRHHYETIKKFGNHSAPVHLDQGRGFGKAFHDQIDILAPIYQCCLVRFSTLKTLLRFDRGPVKLSDAMRKILQEDLVAPVLLEQHLLALDRRVKIILKTIYKCIIKNGDPKKVVIDDGF